MEQNRRPLWAAQVVSGRSNSARRWRGSAVEGIDHAAGRFEIIAGPIEIRLKEAGVCAGIAAVPRDRALTPLIRTSEP